MTWDALPIAFSTFALCSVAATFLQSQRIRYGWRESMRREWIMAEGFAEVSRAIEADDRDRAVGAVNLTSHRMFLELQQQAGRDWVWWRFWQMPPSPTDDWPDDGKGFRPDLN